MQSETWRHTPCHANTWPGFDNIMQSYALIFGGVEHSSLLGWSVSITGSRTVTFRFWRSFSWDPDCAGCAAIRSVHRLCRDLLPHNWADPRLIWDVECVIPSSIEVDFGNSKLESGTYPMSMHWSQEIPTNLPCKQERTLEGWELHGDCGHFLWLTPHWGSQEDCLACLGYRKLRRVIRP